MCFFKNIYQLLYYQSRPQRGVEGSVFCSPFFMNYQYLEALEWSSTKFWQGKMGVIFEASGCPSEASTSPLDVSKWGLFFSHVLTTQSWFSKEQRSFRIGCNDLLVSLIIWFLISLSVELNHFFGCLGFMDYKFPSNIYFVSIYIVIIILGKALPAPRN